MQLKSVSHAACINLAELFDYAAVCRARRRREGTHSSICDALFARIVNDDVQFIHASVCALK